MSPTQLRFCTWGVALTSGASLMLSLLFTRMFSVTMFYHFAFLLVSLAMLGIAVSGVVIYMLPKVFAPERRLLLAGLFAVAIAPLALVAMNVTVHSPLTLDLQSQNLVRLLKLYAVTSLPFLASGFAISLVIASAGPHIGRVYAFDLVGAAVGCVVIIPLTPQLSVPGAVVAAAALAAVGGTLLAAASPASERTRRGVAVVGALVAAVLVVGVAPKAVRREWFRFAQGAKFLQEANVELELWNAQSRVTVSTGTDDFKWIHIDADAATAIWRREFLNPAHQPDNNANRLNMMVYSLRKEGPALIIGPGGGPDGLWALRLGVPRVVGVEVNPLIANNIMRGAYRGWNGGLYDDPRVQIHVDDGRSFVRRSPERYSSIQATLVDTWAASSSGAFALSENNLYTVDAFRDYFNHLKPDGVFSITRWRGSELHRVVVLARSVLAERGVSDAEQRRHFFIVGAGGCASVLVKASAFTEQELDGLEAYGEHIRDVWTVYRPGRGGDAELTRTIEGPAARVVTERTDDIAVVTDDRPFFFFTVKTSDFFRVLTHPNTLRPHDIGLAILQVILLLSFALTLVFVLGPLLLLRRDALREARRPKLVMLGYFACLGVGYILVELALMHRFILFLGHPTYSLSVVLSTLLLSSGIGSSLSPKLMERFGVGGAGVRVVGALVGVLLLYGALLGPLFTAALGLPLMARITITSLLVAAIGVMMGTLLPLGVRATGRYGDDMAAWAWGVNGATSVVGSTLSLVVSINYGFTATLLVGIAAYALAGALIRGARDADPA